MPLKVVLTTDAEQDLEAAVSHLLERNPQAAAVLIEKVFDVAQRLEGVQGYVKHGSVEHAQMQQWLESLLAEP